MSTEIIDAADVAKLIRKALKANFPETKFSVRTDRYAGGASIDVRYTDGPALEDVKRVAHRYQGADFDGMRDLKTYETTILADEDGNVREVQMGADFVNVKRSYSIDALRTAAEKTAEKWGVDAPDVSPPTEHMGARLTGPAARERIHGSREFRTVVHTELDATDLRAQTKAAA